MEAKIKVIAIRVAVIMFFVMSMIGTSANVHPTTACKRAFAGAAIIYIAIQILGRVFTSIIIQRLAQEKTQDKFGNEEDNESQTQF